jgi:hypothetical protein
MRSTIQGKEEMPDWPGFKFDEWLGLLKNGFFFTLIMIVYLVIPFTIAYFGTANQISLWMILISVLVFLAVIFILPMALAFYAATESIWQAFNLPEIFIKIFTNIWTYLLAYVMTVVIFLIFLTIASYVPFLIGLVLVYPSVFAMHAFVQILAEKQ